LPGGSEDDDVHLQRVQPAADRHGAERHDEFTYDLNGNQTQKNDPAAPTTYTWDARDRLVTVGQWNEHPPDAICI
jgi:YD repeat-containing protein